MFLRTTVLALMALTLASPTLAQSYAGRTSGTSASMENGYGNARNRINGGFNPSTRDANNNRIISNGVIQTGQGGSYFNSDGTFGGASLLLDNNTNASATAAGNMITIAVNGSWNTIVLNSKQVNNGNITATTSINGRSVQNVGVLN
ncbi:MAG: holdfast anchoring protein HfaA [Asticcacaulis sp.]